MITSNEVSSKGKIDCNQFIEIYRDVATRPEIYFLMVRYANKDYLSCQDLQLFLETEQGVSVIYKKNFLVKNQIFKILKKLYFFKYKKINFNMFFLYIHLVFRLLVLRVSFVKILLINVSRVLKQEKIII